MLNLCSSTTIYAQNALIFYKETVLAFFIWRNGLFTGKLKEDVKNIENFESALSGEFKRIPLTIEWQLQLQYRRLLYKSLYLQNNKHLKCFICNATILKCHLHHNNLIYNFHKWKNKWYNPIPRVILYTLITDPQSPHHFLLSIMTDVTNMLLKGFKWKRDSSTTS